MSREYSFACAVRKEYDQFFIFFLNRQRSIDTFYISYSLVCHKHENCRGITSEAFIESCIAKLKYSTIRIFYTMERIIHLLTASLLLAAIVSIVVPNPVQASTPREWCWKVGGAGMCFDNKEECRKGIPNGISATCQKQPIKQGGSS